MNPALIEPAAAAGASAVHALLSTNLTPSLVRASSLQPQAGQGQAGSFQTQLAALQTQGIQGLVGMKSGDLQQVISSLNPQQRVALAQQMVGATVSVQNSAGQVVQGVASNLQIQNGTPVFEVAGQTYNLGSIVGVAKPPYV